MLVFAFLIVICINIIVCLVALSGWDKIVIHMPKDDEEEEDPEKTQLQQQCSLTSAHFHKSAEKVVVKEDASKVGWLGGLFVACFLH